MSSSLATRLPLEDTTNEYRTPTPSPPEASAKKGPVLRHKSNQHILHPHLDSSESYPSPHDSVYEASPLNSSAENISWYDAQDWATINSSNDNAFESWKSDEIQASLSNDAPSWENRVVDESGNAVPVSFLEETLSPKKHTPHKLYPITEQNSLATLRPGLSRSTLKGPPSTTTIRPLSPGLNGKKRKSFSASDLPPNPPLSPLGSNPPSPPLLPSSSPQSFHHPLSPISPSHPPPLRIPTPPGLPTFNAPAATSYRLPPPPLRFRDKFRSPGPAEREYVRQTIGLPRGVVMRGENGVLVRGKFTPIRSGHFPPQRQAHALFRLPGEEMPAVRPVVLDQDEQRRGERDREGRRVRFSGPRTEASAGTTTGEGNVDATVLGEGEGGGRKGGERVERVLRRVGWVVGCCGLCEKWDLASQSQKGGSTGSGRSGGERGEIEGGNGEATPLFVGGFQEEERHGAARG